ncbi:hypothetical protein [Microcoleus sp. Pol11C3]
MPVPQEENSSFVERNRQDACSTRRNFISCGTGILPVLKNSATSLIQ